MNPMKVTAIALLLLGTLIACYAAVSITPGGAANSANPSANAMPSAMVLFPFAAIALAAGLGLLLFGGRGTIHTRNPAVRN